MSRCNITVCIKPPTNLRIIIPTRQIIQSRLAIIVVSSVSPWVDLAQPCGVFGLFHFSPGIIAVFRSDGSVTCYDSYDIPLLVQHIVILTSVIVDGVRSSLFVIGYLGAGTDRTATAVGYFQIDTAVFAKVCFSRVTKISREQIRNPCFQSYGGADDVFRSEASATPTASSSVMRKLFAPVLTVPVPSAAIVT